MTQQKFYTYVYYRKDGSPYYVGKGSGKRAYSKQHGVHLPVDSSRIRDIQYWPDEDTALAYEMYLIDFWGRKDIGTGCLRNKNDGGGTGFSGGKHTPEARAKIAASMMGNKRGIGHKVSQIHKDTLRRINSNRVVTSETRAKMRLRLIENPINHWAVETRVKISATLKSKPWSEARRTACKTQRHPPRWVVGADGNKQCTRCGEWKNLHQEFHVHKGSRGGYNSVCKACRSRNPRRSSDPTSLSRSTPA